MEQGWDTCEYKCSVFCIINVLSYSFTVNFSNYIHKHNSYQMIMFCAVGLCTVCFLYICISKQLLYLLLCHIQLHLCFYSVSYCYLKLYISKFKLKIKQPTPGPIEFWVSTIIFWLFIDNIYFIICVEPLFSSVDCTYSKLNWFFTPL